MTFKVALIEGDGIGPEIVAQAKKVLEATGVEIEYVPVQCTYGDFERGTAISVREAIAECKKCDAVLKGPLGTPPDKREMERKLQLEKRLLLGIRQGLKEYANLRPYKRYPGVAGNFVLDHAKLDSKPVDFVVVRENTEGSYAGIDYAPTRKYEGKKLSERQAKAFAKKIGSDAFTVVKTTRRATENITRFGFELARKRRKVLHFADKSNVEGADQFRNDIFREIAKDYPDVKSSPIFRDALTMQILRNPWDYDVIVTDNSFGDILTDEAAALVGGLGMSPAANINPSGISMYETTAGSAPDIAGQNKANPIAMILSAAMMLEYSFEMPELARRVEEAVGKVLAAGYRTADIHNKGSHGISDILDKAPTTSEMGDLIANEYRRAAKSTMPAEISI